MLLLLATDFLRIKLVLGRSLRLEEAGEKEAGLLVGGLVRGRLQLMSRVAEIALVTDAASIRVDGEEVVEQELEEAFSFGPADGRGSTPWTNGGPN